MDGGWWGAVDPGQISPLSSFNVITRGHQASQEKKKEIWTSERVGNFDEAAISSLDDLKE
jgi:hypothetical protein